MTQKRDRIRNIDREYTIKVLVDRQDRTVHDVDSKGSPVSYVSKMFYLVPQMSTEMTQFYDAWLPAVNKNPVTGEAQCPEIAVLIGHPINRAIRGAVQRKWENPREGYTKNHHIVVMTGDTDIEDALNSCVGKYLIVKIAPDSIAEKLLDS